MESLQREAFERRRVEIRPTHSCDVCGKIIEASFRFHCSECPNFDVCPSCFEEPIVRNFFSLSESLFAHSSNRQHPHHHHDAFSFARETTTPSMVRDTMEFDEKVAGNLSAMTLAAFDFFEDRRCLGYRTKSGESIWLKVFDCFLFCLKFWFFCTFCWFFCTFSSCVCLAFDSFWLIFLVFPFCFVKNFFFKFRTVKQTVLDAARALVEYRRLLCDGVAAAASIPDVLTRSQIVVSVFPCSLISIFSQNVGQAQHARSASGDGYWNKQTWMVSFFWLFFCLFFKGQKGFTLILLVGLPDFPHPRFTQQWVRRSRRQCWKKQIAGRFFAIFLACTSWIATSLCPIWSLLSSLTQCLTTSFKSAEKAWKWSHFRSFWLLVRRVLIENSPSDRQTICLQSFTLQDQPGSQKVLWKWQKFLGFHHFFFLAGVMHAHRSWIHSLTHSGMGVMDPLVQGFQTKKGGEVFFFIFCFLAHSFIRSSCSFFCSQICVAGTLQRRANFSHWRRSVSCWIKQDGKYCSRMSIRVAKFVEQHAQTVESAASSISGVHGAKEALGRDGSLQADAERVCQLFGNSLENCNHRRRVQLGRSAEMDVWVLQMSGEQRIRNNWGWRTRIWRTRWMRKSFCCCS